MSKLFETLKRIEAQKKSLDASVAITEKNDGENISCKHTYNLINRLRLPFTILLLSGLTGYLLSIWISNYIPVSTKNNFKKVDESHEIVQKAPQEDFTNNLPSPTLKEERSLVTENKVQKNNLALKTKVGQPTNNTISEQQLKKLLEDIRRLKEKNEKYEEKLKTNKKNSPSQNAEKEIMVSDPYASQKTLKLIQLAEELRIGGRLNGSLDIYRKLWRETHSPLVANNLAAILILLGRYSEGKTILETAIKLSPEDEDLKYNLSLVNRLINEVKY